MGEEILEWLMIPRIERLDEEFYGCRWRVRGYLFHDEVVGIDLVETFADALRYWLWHCGVTPRIAFWTIKRKED